jgi:virulence-associated protein VagC
MTTTQVINGGDGQLVRVPEEFRLASSEVTIRREGNTLVLEPVNIREAVWPIGFFEEVRIDDPAFERPPQGVPPTISL